MNTLEASTLPAVDEAHTALCRGLNAPREIVEELLRVPLFASLRDDTQRCLDFLVRGKVRDLEPGERLVSEGDPAAFYLVLSGDLHVLKKGEGKNSEGESEQLLATHHEGAFFGEVPLLLGTEFFASGQAVDKARVFHLDEDAFWQMLSLCPSVTKTVLRTMASRVQSLETISQGREKLASLGTMAAGLAHELNNPAAAAMRAAQEMREVVREIPHAACKFNKQHLPPESLEWLAQAQQELARAEADPVPLDALARSDRESEIEDWLDEKGVAEGWKHASTLVEAGVQVEWLHELSERVPDASLDAVFSWMGSTLSIEHLAGEIESSTGRISDLVRQVKGYSHMDQSPLQAIDLHEELESTLTLLGHKMREAGVEIVRDYDRSIGRLCAFGSELNQVWTNLLDNAVDALTEVEGARRITLRTRQEPQFAVVEIEDSGTGIEPELQKSIFEPFFTTKSVGKGTGLGLGISHRIVTARHKGQIEVDSQPGHTVFTVRLPIDLEKQLD